jgi:integrase
MQDKWTIELFRRFADRDPPSRDESIFDTVVQRVAIRRKPATQAGGRWPTWAFIRYTAPDGSERRMKCGDPRTMGPDEIRKRAKALLAIVDAGGDPARDQRNLRAAWTVAQAAEAYLGSAEFAKKTRKVRSGDTSTINNHIVHRLAGEKLSSIDVPMVKRLLRAVEGDTRLNARKRKLGGPGAARKVARTLSSLLTWAVGEGHLPRNPIIGNLRLNGDGSRDTVLDRREQYAALFAAMAALVEDGELRQQSQVFITVKACTGMRRGELQHLRWGQVDLVGRRITLTLTKGGRLARSGPKVETISLPELAAAALMSIRPERPAPEDQVFVPLQGDVIEINRDWLKVRAKAGLPEELTLHGLRHSAGTVAIIAGLSTAEVQKLLRHRNISTTAKYIHLAEASRSRLQDRAMAGVLPTGPATQDGQTLRRAGAPVLCLTTSDGGDEPCLDST